MGADSCPETSFRELDDVFLQTQARIWLGEVVNNRLDEQQSLSDSLADGELLFEVSKVVWSLLLEKCVELRGRKSYQSPLGSRNSSGRYKPYSNVDSFLKVCKILGLNGIDLFSPSDVVEKRNTRKVCICIRALSKKARLKQLDVPHFDSVTYAVAMPTDMVGCIRRSLESPLCSLSSCSSSNSYKQTSSRSQPIKLPSSSSSSSSNGSYDAYSEESDAESAYCGTEKYDHPAMLNSDVENSEGALSVVNCSKTKQVSPSSDKRTYNRYGKSCCSQHSGYALRAKSLTTFHFANRGDLNNKDMHTNSGIRDRFGNISELAEVNLALGNHDPEVGDAMSGDIVGTSFISDYLAFSESVILGNNGAGSVFSDGEDNICNFFLSIDSQGFDSSLGTSPNGLRHRAIDDMEDVEVSSTASMSSILGRVLNMDLDDQSNYRDSSTVKVHSMIELFEKGTDCHGKYSIMDDQTQAPFQYDVLSQCSAADIEESHSAIQPENEVAGKTLSMENMGMVLAEKEEDTCKTVDLMKAVIGVTDFNPNLVGHVSNYTSGASLHHNMCMEANVSHHKGSLKGKGSYKCRLENEDVPAEITTHPELDKLHEGAIVSNTFTSLVSETSVPDKNKKFPSENERISTGGGHQTHTGSSSSTHFPTMTEDFQDENNVYISPETATDTSDQRCNRRLDKPHRRSLLNTVVTGTTLVGALLFWLHIRKGKEQTDESRKSVKGPRFVGTKLVSQRGQNSTSNGMYPAEKLQLGS